MSADEERRFSELYDLYCRDMAEPEGEVAVISSKDEYNGEGIAFSKEEGILNLPMQEMTDEEILQLGADRINWKTWKRIRRIPLD